MFKKSLVVAMVFTGVFSTTAFADSGVCVNSSWVTRNAGSIDVEIRTCVINNYSHVEVRNPFDKPICVSTVATKTVRRWTQWECKPGGMLEWVVKGSDEIWQVGAFMKSGSS